MSIDASLAALAENNEKNYPVGRNIRKLRKERRMWQRELAEAVSRELTDGRTVYQSDISDIEQGKADVTVGELVAFANVFKVLPADLLKAEE